MATTFDNNQGLQKKKKQLGNQKNAMQFVIIPKALITSYDVICRRVWF